MLFFEYHRGYIAERAVAPRRVVEGLDIVENGKLGLVVIGRDGGRQICFGFQGTPERLHGCIVIAVAGAAHGLTQSPLGQPATYLGAGVLTAAV